MTRYLLLVIDAPKDDSIRKAIEWPKLSERIQQLIKPSSNSAILAENCFLIASEIDLPILASVLAALNEHQGGLTYKTLFLDSDCKPISRSPKKS